MKTIPLEPVFENRLFQDSRPIIKYAVLNAVYLLCKQRKAHEPIPEYLEPYLGLCNPGYYRNKDVCRAILNVVMPQICKIKNLKLKQTLPSTMANVKKAAKRREQRLYNVEFTQEADSHVKISPVFPDLEKRNYHQGHYDPVAVKQAKKANESDKEAWLSDD